MHRKLCSVIDAEKDKNIVENTIRLKFNRNKIYQISKSTWYRLRVNVAIDITPSSTCRCRSTVEPSRKDLVSRLLNDSNRPIDDHTSASGNTIAQIPGSLGLASAFHRMPFGIPLAFTLFHSSFTLSLDPVTQCIRFSRSRRHNGAKLNTTVPQMKVYKFK